jgi:poly(hydroxyalkanoate) depolymerase family esterase
MAGLTATTRDLAELRKRWKERIAAASQAGAGATAWSASGRLTRVQAFGSNPGGLDMFTYVPAHLPERPALVVVLHGCTQDAEGYDLGTGWSHIADEYGFVLVYPQQSRANNPNLCFNWFQPGDTTRGQGEALSIREMVDRAAAEHGCDPSRIFVTGLSAGGAMAAVMLATYPEVFAAGGIVAGLPFGSAANVHQALQAMSGSSGHPAGHWGDLVRRASHHTGRWPRLSVWHGGADTVVRPDNAEALVRQWTDLHGLPAEPTDRTVVDGHSRDVWRGPDGEDVIESFTISGMGHGTPLQVGEEAGMGGTAGAYMLDVGISSSHHMAAFWGLAASATYDVPEPRSESQVPSPHVYDGEIIPPGRDDAPRPANDAGAQGAAADGAGAQGPAAYVERIITETLRANLMPKGGLWRGQRR